MNDDIIERVARAICLNRAAPACNCEADGVCKARIEDLLHETHQVGYQTRAAIAECFKLRDMKDAPDNKEILAKDDAGYWYLLHKNNGEWMADDGSLPDFPLVGWLPLPELESGNGK